MSEYSIDNIPKELRCSLPDDAQRELQKLIEGVSNKFNSDLNTLCETFSPRVLHHFVIQDNPGWDVLLRYVLCTAYSKPLAYVEVRRRRCEIIVHWAVLAPGLQSSEDEW